MGEIVVGIDGSDGSRAALRWAARTAAARGAGLRAVAAWQYPARAVSPAGAARLPGADEMDERTRGDLSAVVHEELDAEAAAALLHLCFGRCSQCARAQRGGFAGLLLGSVSQECVEHSSCPVVVLRGEPELPDGPIIVGLDGSEGAARARDWAIDLAEATGAHIVAVHVPVLGANNAMMAAASEALEEWCAPIEARAVPHEMRIEPGDARTVLEGAADATGASLLVVGTRGLGAVRGLLLGSVAGYVARYSQRPIAIVPRSTS